MSWFKKAARGTLTGTDIVDAYIINELINSPYLDEDKKRRLNFEAQMLKDKFVNVFTELMRGQIKKYLEDRPRSDKRVVEGTEEWLATYPAASVEELALMLETATQRSVRRQQSTGEIVNEAWGIIGNKTAELNMAQEADSIVRQLIHPGGLFNLVHNAGGPVLGKLPGSSQIRQALDFSHSIREPRMLLAKASPDIQSLAREIGI